MEVGFAGWLGHFFLSLSHFALLHCGHTLGIRSKLRRVHRCGQRLHSRCTRSGFDKRRLFCGHFSHWLKLAALDHLYPLGNLLTCPVMIVVQMLNYVIQ